MGWQPGNDYIGIAVPVRGPAVPDSKDGHPLEVLEVEEPLSFVWQIWMNRSQFQIVVWEELLGGARPEFELFASWKHAVVPKERRAGEGVTIRRWDWLRCNMAEGSMVHWLTCEDDVW